MYVDMAILRIQDSLKYRTEVSVDSRFPMQILNSFGLEALWSKIPGEWETKSGEVKEKKIERREENYGTEGQKKNYTS